MNHYREFVQQIKAAARGRWVEILEAVGRFDRSILDGKNHPCPLCGGKDRFRLIDADAGAVYCNQCFSKGNGDGLAAIQRVRRIDFKTACREVGKYLGIEEPQRKARSKKAVGSLSPKKKAERADSDTLDKAYRLLFSRLMLSDEHHAALRQRGLSDQAIFVREYRSWDMADAAQSVAAVNAEMGAILDRVPGFWRGKLCAPPGLLIPVRDLAGRITAVKVRPDKPGTGGKYLYLSSAKKGGPSPGAPAHIPLGIARPATIARIVEGELKGDLTTELSGMPTISFPGVNSWKVVPPMLKELGATTVRVAFDADAKGNPAVAKKLVECVEALPAQGFAVELEVWDEADGKGIDDLLAAGKTPVVVAGDEALAAARAIAEAAGVGPPESPVTLNEAQPPAANITVDGLGDLLLTVHPSKGKVRRQVIARIGERQHVDRIDVTAAAARARFWKSLARKVNAPWDALEAAADGKLLDLAEAVDQQHPAEGDGCDGENEQKSAAQRAIELAAEWDLWHTPAGEGYATVPVGDHIETWGTKSTGLRAFLHKCFYEAYDKPINGEALTTAISLLDARAQFDGEAYPVFTRVAEHNGNVYLDLCNADWQVVEVAPNGWQVIDQSPVRFRRTKGMLPLPIPERGGRVDELRAFVNVSDETWPLVVGWELGMFNPRGPYSILTLGGIQGSGKSTTGRILRGVADPAKPALRSPPRDERDLMIAAKNAWLLAYDNLSSIPVWLSDALCRVNSGGGFATRELYTNDEESIFDASRPALLTSIEDVASRSDLLDRCLVVGLEPLLDDCRIPERELYANVSEAQPRILGALLDCVSAILRNLPTVEVDRPSRMLDFLLWVTAAESELGWEPGTFLNAYDRNRGEAHTLALEASPIAKPLLAFLDAVAGDEWVGTAAELLGELNKGRNSNERPPKGWPESPRGLSGQIKRLAPNLPAAGWHWDPAKPDSTAKRNRSLTIRRVAQPTVRTVQSAEVTSSSPPAADDADASDGCLRSFSADSIDAVDMEGGDA